MNRYGFGPFELRPDGTLLREGRPIDLSPKQRGLLAILAKSGGRVVSKREILDRLWPEEDVSEASLTTCVRGLRLALGDQARRGGYLETVHGRGYRFHATVCASPDGGGERPIRIAVAPFATEAGSDRYLAAGLAGEVAAGLDRWRGSGLVAIARTSAERGLELRQDPFAFAEALGLDFLATGRSATTARELRIDIDLTRVEDRVVVWSETFIEPARGSGFIAAEIAEALAKHLLVLEPIAPPSPVIPPLSVDARAHHALLRGYFLNQHRTESGLRRSIECFERAAAWDARCAAAYAALGEAYLMLGWRGYEAPLEIAPLARQALARALAIDPDSPQAHAARAFLAASVDRDHRAADEALAIAAGRASAHDRSAWLCGMAHLTAGHCEDALRVIETGLALDPLSPNLLIAQALVLWFGGRSAEALAAVRDLTETEPEFPATHALHADIAASIGRRDEALQRAGAADTLGRGDQMTRTGCAWAFGQAGRREAGRTILDAFERRARTRYVSPTLMAVGYAGIDDPENALRWLTRAAEVHCMWLAYAPFDPRLALLREDPRCRAILVAAAHRER